MRMMLVLDREEVQREIPYALICETRFGATWDTGRRRRMWKELFTQGEREAAYRLFSLAHRWYLVKGVPDEVKMTPETLRLWQKLGMFCAAV